MKLFKERQVREAIEHAQEGGQALHVWQPPVNGEGRAFWPGAPEVFRKTGARGWAHLLDQDEERLTKTARRLGVKVVRVAKRGQREQHIDLCGKPLEKAIKECDSTTEAQRTQRRKKREKPGFLLREEKNNFG